MTKPKFLDYLLVGLQFGLFGLYLLPLEIDISLPKLLLWPAQLAMIVGLIICFWALVQIGKRISPFPRPKEETELITWGIFGMVRHPIYSGVFLFCVGLGFYTEDAYRVLIAIALLILFYFKSSFEESNMTARFEHYPEYKKKVGRFFPKLSATKPK